VVHMRKFKWGIALYFTLKSVKNLIILVMMVGNKMIVSKTPFRISFAGGLSDIRNYYYKNYGAVVSSTIDKYLYVMVNKKFDDNIQVNYSKIEITEEISQIQHPLVREVLKMMNINRNIEITIMSDIPARTGLGSSSSFTVGLLNALYAFNGEYKDAEALAREACHIEIDILKEPIGKQDQYASAYGGLNYIRFNADDTVNTIPINMRKETKKELEKNLLLFYTNLRRDASSILSESSMNMESHRTHVDQIKNLAEDIASSLQKNDLSRFGELLHQGWIHKKQTGKVTNEIIDTYYEKARKAGALGGKILGAGGGGFLLLYCPEKNQERVRKALSSLKKITFHFESGGSRIICKEV